MYRKNQSRRPLNPLMGVAFGLLFLGLGIFTGVWFQEAYAKAYADPEAQCKIVSKSIVESQGESEDGGSSTMYGTSFSLDVQPKNGQMAFKAEVNGRVLGGTSSNENDAQAFLSRYMVGKSYPCWYDPTNHSSVILDRSLMGDWLFLLGALIFIVVGFGLLIVSLVKIFVPRRNILLFR